MKSSTTLLLMFLLLGSSIADVNEGLVSHWRFETVENDSIVTDIVGKDADDNPYIGVLKSTAQIVPGVIGNCLLLTAQDSSYVDTNYPGIMWDEPRSFTAWIKTDSAQQACILSYGSEVKSEKVEFRLDGDVIRIENFGGFIKGVTPVTDGEWHHVAAVIIAQGEGIKTVGLYVDGIWEEVEGSNENPFLTTDTMSVRIGMSGPRGDRHFEGCIDEVRIYARDLDEAEIDEIMTADLANTAVQNRIVSIPTDFTLGNYPNPFNPSTQIRYALPSNSTVELNIYDITGKHIKQLFYGQQSAGQHTAVWDGLNQHGARASSGIYIVHLTTDEQSSSLKIVLAK